MSKRFIIPVAVAVFAFAMGAHAEDSLQKIQERGKLTVCADPYNWPHSSSSDYPRGFDVEIFERIASANDLQMDVYWSDTGTRGGLGRAMRHSISKGRCDVFAGIAMIPDTIDELQEKNLVFSDPYVGLAYVPVVTSDLKGVKTISALAKRGRIGVSMSTAMDGYLIDNGIDRALYLGNRRVLDGIANGEIKAAFVWGPALAQESRRTRNQNLSLVEEFEPIPGLRWNVAAAIPGDQPALIEFVNSNLSKLQNDGTIDGVLSNYKFPAYSPFSE